jgi:hypothetical protein
MPFESRQKELIFPVKYGGFASIAFIDGLAEVRVFRPGIVARPASIPEMLNGSTIRAATRLTGSSGTKGGLQ